MPTETAIETMGDGRGRPRLGRIGVCPDQSGGGCGIRTREGVNPTRFPSERHRPLGESSARNLTGKLRRGRIGTLARPEGTSELRPRVACTTPARRTMRGSPRDNIVTNRSRPRREIGRTYRQSPESSTSMALRITTDGTRTKIQFVLPDDVI